MAKSRKVFNIKKNECQRSTKSKFDPNPSAVLVAVKAENEAKQSEVQEKQGEKHKDKKTKRILGIGTKVKKTKNNNIVVLATPKIDVHLETPVEIERVTIVIPDRVAPSVHSVIAHIPKPPAVHSVITNVSESNLPITDDATPTKIVSKNHDYKKKEVVNNALVEPFKHERCWLWLNSEYKIHGRQGSAYRLIFEIIAQEGKFQEVLNILKRTELKDKTLEFNPENQDMARELLDMMMIRRDTIEPILRAHKDWKSHAEVRATQISNRANSGNDKAKKTISNPKRFDGNGWVGNIPEMISVCCGSYKPAWQRARGIKAVKRRDSNKLAKAKIVIRKCPREEKKDEPMFIMIYPEKYFKIIERAILTVYGRDETNHYRVDELKTKDTRSGDLRPI